MHLKVKSASDKMRMYLRTHSCILIFSLVTGITMYQAGTKLSENPLIDVFRFEILDPLGVQIQILYTESNKCFAGYKQTATKTT